MNRYVSRTLTIVSCAGLLSSTALAGLYSDGVAKVIDPAHDPLYWSNRLSERCGDATVAPEPNGSLNPARSGGGGGMRGGCVSCTELETEQNCGTPTDTVNGGCNSNPPAFASIQCGQEFCGSGATNGTIRDTDWWMFEVAQTSIVTVTVTADFALQMGIGDLSDGCPIAGLLVGVFGEECTPSSITQTLEPGTYVAFVAPQFLPEVACGARYAGTLQCAVQCPCPGDFDGDRIVSLSDLALFLSNFGIQPSDPCMDFTRDGVVGLGDLSIFLPTFGTSCP